MRRATKDEMHQAFVLLGIDQPPADVVSVSIRDGVVEAVFVARDVTGEPRVVDDPGFADATGTIQDRGRAPLTYTLRRRMWGVRR